MYDYPCILRQLIYQIPNNHFWVHETLSHIESVTLHFLT